MQFISFNLYDEYESIYNLHVMFKNNIKTNNDNYIIICF